jgi:hypothetical protein
MPRQSTITGRQWRPEGRSAELTPTSGGPAFGNATRPRHPPTLLRSEIDYKHHPATQTNRESHRQTLMTTAQRGDNNNTDGHKWSGQNHRPSTRASRTSTNAVSQLAGARSRSSVAGSYSPRADDCADGKPVAGRRPRSRLGRLSTTNRTSPWRPPPPFPESSVAEEPGPGVTSLATPGFATVCAGCPY